jgi:hypothetical protein
MLRTNRAAGAIISDSVFDEGRASACRAPALEMRFVFVPEITQRSEHRIGSSFAESAKAAGADLTTESLKFDEVLLLAFARAETFKDVEHPASADAAERAFAAGLVLGELEEVAGDVHHARAIIEDDESA